MYPELTRNEIERVAQEILNWSASHWPLAAGAD